MFNFFKSVYKQPTHSAGSMPQTTSSTDTSNPVYNGNCPADLKDKVVFAFKSGDRNYFMFNAELNIPFNRFMCALDIYDELELGLNPGIIQKFLQTLNEICVDPKVKNVDQIKQKIGIAAYMVQERIDIHTSLSLHMKLATVRFFDEIEDVTGYDHEFNVQKIKFWTANHDIQDFFFMQPIQSFLPQLTDFNVNLQKYLDGEILQSQRLMDCLTQFGLQESTEPELQSYLLQQMEILETMKSWAKNPSMSTV